ncbi:hypothetical protein [Roseospira goensis]|uniref:Uncharacterized protein n=1 Tax=Roseospira goensis TaxID=391922 RepID=A0A7W6WJ89_9PROT|nr:hypothetical protein [Roseospira goensis]MBB4284323.1 hypothetical protein [Roseospira goensis]
MRDSHRALIKRALPGLGLAAAGVVVASLAPLQAMIDRLIDALDLTKWLGVVLAPPLVEALTTDWRAAVLGGVGLFAGVSGAGLAPVRAATDRLLPDPPPFLDRTLFRDRADVFSPYARPDLFVGRDLSPLMRFAGGDVTGLAWWALHGPPGCGKSRLALEWLRRLATLERGRRWDAGVLRPEALRDPDVLARWRFRRHTAIVLDDAGEHPARWARLARLAANPSTRKVRVRVLFVERTRPRPQVGGPGDLSPDLRPHWTAVLAACHGGGTDPSLPVADLGTQAVAALAARVQGTPLAEADLHTLLDRSGGRPLSVVAGALAGTDRDAAAVFRARAEALVTPDDPVRARVLVLAALAGPVERTAVRAALGDASRTLLETLFPTHEARRLRREIPVLRPETVAQAVLLQCLIEYPEAARDSAAAAFTAAPAVAAHRFARLWLDGPDAEAALDLAAAPVEDAPGDDAAMARARAMLDLARVHARATGHDALAPVDIETLSAEQHAHGAAGRLWDMLAVHTEVMLALAGRPDDPAAEHGRIQALLCALRHVAEHAPARADIDPAALETALGDRLSRALRRPSARAEDARAAAGHYTNAIWAYGDGALSEPDPGRAERLWAALAAARRRLAEIDAGWPDDAAVAREVARGAFNLITAYGDGALAATTPAQAKRLWDRVREADDWQAALLARWPDDAALAVLVARGATNLICRCGPGSVAATTPAEADRLWDRVGAAQDRQAVLLARWPDDATVAHAVARSATMLITACGEGARASAEPEKAERFWGWVFVAYDRQTGLLARWPDDAAVAVEVAQGATNLIAVCGQGTVAATTPTEAERFWGWVVAAHDRQDALLARWPDDAAVAVEVAQGANNLINRFGEGALATTMPQEADRFWGWVVAAHDRQDALLARWPDNVAVAEAVANCATNLIHYCGKGALDATKLAEAERLWSLVVAAEQQQAALLARWPKDSTVAGAVAGGALNMLITVTGGACLEAVQDWMAEARAALTTTEHRVARIIERWIDEPEIAFRIACCAVLFIRERLGARDTWFAIARRIRERHPYDDRIAAELQYLDL